MYRVRLKNIPDKNCNFSELAGYFTSKFCTIILKSWLHFFIVLYAHLIFLKSNYVNLCRNGRIWKTKYDFCQPLKIILYLWPYLVRFQKSEILVENDNFSYPVPFNLHDHLWSLSPCEFFQKFNTNCASPWAIRRWKNIAEKFNLLGSVQQRHRPRTDDRWTARAIKRT